jgi:hypothetical protein
MNAPAVDSSDQTRDYRLLYINATARYVRITVTPASSAWSFTDELQVKTTRPVTKPPRSRGCQAAGSPPPGHMAGGRAAAARSGRPGGLSGPRAGTLVMQKQPAELRFHMG